jgi:hypothetical protein
MAIPRLLNPALKIVAAALMLLCALLLVRTTTGNSSSRPLTGSPARKAVLAELFTSEGCSSCPPADALLGTLRQEFATAGFEVIPLGLHVDYWNSLGWRDRFSAAEFSGRQEQYARALGTDGPYTPQLVIDGRAEFVGSDRARARSAIVEAAGRPQAAGIELSIDTSGKLMVKASSAKDGAAVMLAITEDNLATKVGAGENNGRELRHAAVVRELRRLGAIQNGNFESSVPLAMEKDWKPADLRAVVFVQQGSAGEVLGAASVPLHVQQR